MTVRVEDFELIVGDKAKTFCVSYIPAERIGESYIPYMEDVVCGRSVTQAVQT